MTTELRVYHGNLNMLHNHAANVSHRLPGVIGNDYVCRNLFAMIVDFSIQSNFKIDLSIAESESFAHERAGKTTSSGSRGMLQLQENILIHKVT